MTDVCIALAPAGVAAMVIFGWQAVALIVVSVLAALVSELMMCKVFKKKSTLPDGSAFVTGLLVAYNMPANAPWWLAAIGSAFAIIIVKQLFGGLGHNFLNPAITARAFMLASWPAFMTSFMKPALWKGGDGISAVVPLMGSADAISSATPLAALSGRAYPYPASYMDMFLGNSPGSLGEVCALALLLGGLYLILRRVIDWRIPVVFLGGIMLFTWLGGDDPLYAVLTGGAMLGAFFMLTDYVTSPVTSWGRVIFALGAAFIVFAIRKWSSAYPEGMTYGIMIMNILTPLIERFTKPKIYGEVAKRA
jgi:electron transport complex protein RnfD